MTSPSAILIWTSWAGKAVANGGAAFATRGLLIERAMMIASRLRTRTPNSAFFTENAPSTLHTVCGRKYGTRLHQVACRWDNTTLGLQSSQEIAVRELLRPDLRPTLNRLLRGCPYETLCAVCARGCVACDWFFVASRANYPGAELSIVRLLHHRPVQYGRL